MLSSFELRTEKKEDFFVCFALDLFFLTNWLPILNVFLCYYSLISDIIFAIQHFDRKLQIKIAKRAKCVNKMKIPINKAKEMCSLFIEIETKAFILIIIYISYIELTCLLIVCFHFIWFDSMASDTIISNPEW